MEKRKIIRLQNFDYAQNGVYFITICTNNKKPLFGVIEGQGVALNEFGKIAQEEIEQTNILRQKENVQVTKYVVMPNHVPMLIQIVGSRRAVTATEQFSAPAKQSIPTIVRAYKSAVTRRVHMLGSEAKIWQSRFYDHVVRNDREYLKIWEYIDTNPLKWTEDCYFEDGHGVP